MPSYATHLRRFVAAAAPLLLTSAAAGQAVAPVPVGQALDEPGTPVDPPKPAGAEDAVGADAAPAAGEGTVAIAEGERAAPPATPGLSVIARWLRNAECRIFLHFPLDETCYISKPNSDYFDDRPLAAGDDRLSRTWRISLPRHEDSRIVPPPARVTRAPEPAGASTEVASEPGADH